MRGVSFTLSDSPVRPRPRSPSCRTRELMSSSRSGFSTLGETRFGAGRAEVSNHVGKSTFRPRPKRGVRNLVQCFRTRRCLGTCGYVGNGGVCFGPRTRAFTSLRGLLAFSVHSSDHSISAEDGTVRLLLELRPEEDWVEDDVLGVDPANAELLKKGPAALSMERNELVVRRPSFE